MIARWTPENDQQLRDMIGRGMTASQIAAHFGVWTRNAVCGRAHRLKLRFINGGPTRREQSTLPPQPQRTPRRPLPPRKIESASEPAAPLPLDREARFQPILDADPVPFADLDRSKCAWPVSGLKGVADLFCGRPVKHGRYCGAHISLAYQPRSSLKESRNGKNP